MPEMNEFKPCSCKSNDPHCPKCLGTGMERHEVNNKLSKTIMAELLLPTERGWSFESHDPCVCQDEDFVSIFGPQDDCPFCQGTRLLPRAHRNHLVEQINDYLRNSGGHHVHGPDCNHEHDDPMVDRFNVDTAPVATPEDRKIWQQKWNDADFEHRDVATYDDLKRVKVNNPRHVDANGVYLGSWKKRYESE